MGYQREVQTYRLGQAIQNPHVSLERIAIRGAAEMKIYSAAITVEFRESDAALAEGYQNYLAELLKKEALVVYTDTIGPPECIEGCND